MKKETVKCVGTRLDVESRPVPHERPLSRRGGALHE